MLKYRRYFSGALSILAAVAVMLLLIFFSADAAASARAGFSLCARVIAPSLFPFFVVSALITELGIPKYIGKLTGPVMNRLFGVGGAGASAFILGLFGGYPTGAVTVRDMYRRGDVSKDEAERLLGFCNNSGPAFILGAAGTGVFGSAAIGLALYAAHATASALVGILMSGKTGKKTNAGEPLRFQVVNFSSAFTNSVKGSVNTTLTICGFVVFFSVLVGVLDSLGIWGDAAGIMSLWLGLPLGWIRSLLTGILELGSGIGSMAGFTATPLNLALAAFMLGWGGLSVHFQVLSVLGGTNLKCARHFIGRILNGLISALLVYISAFLIL